AARARPAGERRRPVRGGAPGLPPRRPPGPAAPPETAGGPAARALDEVDIGWRIAPRLNAPGRLGDAAPALATLLAADAVEAQSAAAACEAANLRRRELQDLMFTEALAEAEAQGDASAIVVARPGWHAGVAGIVAAKPVDRSGRPAPATPADARGGGRAPPRPPPGFALVRAPTACSGHLVRYGGHAQAAGLTVVADKIPALRTAFAAEAARRSAVA